MMKLLTCLSNLFRRKSKVHFITCSPFGLEVSDGDRATLYGWPDKYVHEVIADDD